VDFAKIFLVGGTEVMKFRFSHSKILKPFLFKISQENVSLQNPGALVPFPKPMSVRA